ncbi:Ldh family oxidoreductase [Burkholderia mallei]|uniref:Ldh family oxidoreductase n=1 Tax=Burkholderia mallei TaxID=13373 RepID=UPI003BEEFFDB
MRALALRVLAHHGLSDAHARAIANVITQGQRDECHSHGVYRLLVCARSLRLARSTRKRCRRCAAVAVDRRGRRASRLLAARVRDGLPVLVEMARRHGIARWRSTAATTSRRCGRGRGARRSRPCRLAMNPSHGWVAPEGGTRPVFGTNPLAFAWPRRAARRSCSISRRARSRAATSNCTRKRASRFRRTGRSTRTGAPTTDPQAALQARCARSAGTRARRSRR